MKNASASSSSKSQMLPSSLPLPQKFNRFHNPGANKAKLAANEIRNHALNQKHRLESKTHPFFNAEQRYSSLLP